MNGTGLYWYFELWALLFYFFFKEDCEWFIHLLQYLLDLLIRIVIKSSLDERNKYWFYWNLHDRRWLWLYLVRKLIELTNVVACENN